LMTMLLYGAGLRLMECCRLRVVIRVFVHFMGPILDSLRNEIAVGNIDLLLVKDMGSA
jgi:hypothetical protein